MKKEQNLETSTEQALTIPVVRQRFLLMCQKQYGLWAEEIKEETPFYKVVNDSLDFIELILRCEKEFKISIDETDKDEFSFNTIGEFIDWASLNVG